MDVQLPNGIILRNVPENATKSEIISKLKANGYEVPADWLPAKEESRSIGQQVVGAGEAALTAATGATGGTVGAIGGALKGLAEQILSGNFGTPQAANLVEKASQEGAQALTYQPRTQAGQEIVQDVLAPVGQALAPLAGLAPQMAGIARASEVLKPSAGAAGQIASAGAKRGVSAAASATTNAYKSAGDKISSAFGIDSAPKGKASGGSVGAAGAEMATQIDETAKSLPVPLNLTEGMVTRNPDQLRFERQQMGRPIGEPLREAVSGLNRGLAQNLEAMIDRTGAAAPSFLETGRAVNAPLVKAVAQSKAKYRSLYNQADEAGQLSDPVDFAPVVQYLNENRGGRSSAPIMNVLADQLKVREVGGGSITDGTLYAGPMNLKQAEALRKDINRFVKDIDPNDVRVASDLRSLIDKQTEGLGGDLYKEARKARQRHAQLFDNNAVVRDLLATRKGTADRKVAFEDVFNRTILNGSREDLSMLRRTLQIAGGEEGAQAWRELQGATLRKILDDATGGVTTDQNRVAVFSAPKLNNAIRQLDADSKLDFVLGKKGAQTLRDLNEVAKAIETLPPGTVSSSGSAEAFIAAIAEAGVTGSLTGIPVPVASVLRVGVQHVKDQKVKARIQQALRQNERQPQQVNQ